MSSNLLKILIVDDVEDSLDLLESILKEIHDVELAGRASNVEEANRIILRDNPDLVMLDIQMPGKTGLELVNELKLKSVNINVIFVTAHDEYAIQAIKASAFDYILKPVDPEEVVAAIQRFRKSRETDISLKLDTILTKLDASPRIRFNTRTGSVFINPDDIIFCKAEGNYSLIVLEEKKEVLVVTQLGLLYKQLESRNFLRIGRSLLINRSFLNRIDRKQRTIELSKNGQSFVLKVPRKISLNLIFK